MVGDREKVRRNRWRIVKHIRRETVEEYSGDERKQWENRKLIRGTVGLWDTGEVMKGNSGG
jgi:hypothetical protein